MKLLKKFAINFGVGATVFVLRETFIKQAKLFNTKIKKTLENSSDDEQKTLDKANSIKKDMRNFKSKSQNV
jgi:hypothetical protein